MPSSYRVSLSSPPLSRAEADDLQGALDTASAFRLNGKEAYVRASSCEAGPNGTIVETFEIEVRE